MKRIRLMVLGGSLVVSMAGFAAQEPAPAPASQDQPKPDNTKVNKRDRDANAMHAGKQKGNPNDRETSRQIRRSIVKDKSLSTYAHNIKIITRDGMVTLKGPVRTEEEKSNVEAKAAAVVGQDKVKSEIEIAPKKS